MNWFEPVAAGVVGVALLWLVLQPMLFPRPAGPLDLDPLDAEETPRGRALLALKEIEFDRATGKLSDADFVMLNARYSADAIAAMDAPAAGPRCLQHGERREAGARFCPVCGAGLVSVDDACANCGRPILPGARFCAGCGTALKVQAEQQESRREGERESR